MSQMIELEDAWEKFYNEEDPPPRKDVEDAIYNPAGIYQLNIFRAEMQRKVNNFTKIKMDLVWKFTSVSSAGYF